MKDFWKRLSRRRRYDDISVSIQEHLEEAIEELMLEGMSYQEAAHAARRQFGNVTLLEERSREQWQFGFLEQFLTDVRYAFRQLKKAPGFTATALITLSLAIGANTATFSLLHALLLRSLPVANPQQLVKLHWIEERPKGVSSSGYSDDEFPYPFIEQLRNNKKVFSSLFGLASFGFKQGNIGVRKDGETLLATGTMVTDGYFGGLGVTPVAGRFFGPADMSPSATRVVVISHSYWQRRFAGSPSALGQTIFINTRPYMVIGVAAKGFTGVQSGVPDDLWIPVIDDPQLRPWQSDPPQGEAMLHTHRWWWLTIMGRLQPGLTPQQAQTALSPVLLAELRESGATIDSSTSSRLPQLVPAGKGLQYSHWEYDEPAKILMALVALVLLAACANLATLQLARSEARTHEIALRLALGARKGRVLRQLLTESSLLSFGGGALGVLVAVAATQLFRIFLSSGNNPLSFDLQLDHVVLSFTTALSVLTALLFGLAPAWSSMRVEVNSTLKDGSALSHTGGRRRALLGKSFVITQAAISALLLVGAGLFLHTLVKLKREVSGFHPEHMLVFRLNPSANGLKPEQESAVYEQLRLRLLTLPGVRSATHLSLRMIDGWISNFPVHIEGVAADDKEGTYMLSNIVGPDFLKTTGVPLLMGRDFTTSDTQRAPHVAIVNQAAVDKYFGGRNPIGRQISYKPNDQETVGYTIIGVCGNTHYESLRAEIQPTWYFPLAQNHNPQRTKVINIALRAEGDPATLKNTVQRTVREFDPRLLVIDMKTQTQQIEDSLAAEWMLAKLSVFFGITALLLAAVGLYGTMSYSITRRTREIGIRIVLGAAKGKVIAMVLRQSLVLVLSGVALGLIAAFISGRFVASLLYGIKPQDGISYLIAAILLVAVAAFATWNPASRAARINPSEALRSE